MIFYLGKANNTKGDWIEQYGNYAYILPDPPVSRVPCPIGNYTNQKEGFTLDSYGWTDKQIMALNYYRETPPYWDEFKSSNPRIEYEMSGTKIRKEVSGVVQYPVFEWAWDEGHDSKDPRSLHYPSSLGKRLACWFDGSERGFPSEGYFNVSLTFPEGKYRLSLYAYDAERNARTGQWIKIYNASHLNTATKMEGEEFDEGIYHKYLVLGPTKIKINIVKSPDSINAILSGIFIDKIK
jgi:hypothetical protein